MHCGTIIIPLNPLFMYYLIKYDLAVIGREFPQIQDNFPDYDYKSPYTWRNKPLYGKMEQPPIFGTQKLHHYAKRTDFLSCIHLSDLNNWLISPAFWAAMQDLQLPNYQLFDMVVGKGNARFPYHIFHLYDTNAQIIDFERSTFYLIETKTGKPKEHCVIKKIDLADHHAYNAWFSSRPKDQFILCRTIHLLPNAEELLDVARMWPLYRDIIVSERFKNAIEQSGVTGAAFEALAQPMRNRLRWADTGLPVED